MVSLVLKRGAEFRPTPNGTESALGPSVSALADGGFITAWWEYEKGIVAQRYGPDRLKLGEPFLVDPGEGNAEVTGLTSGGFVISWLHRGLLRARLYDEAGSAAGPAFTVTEGSDFYAREFDSVGLPGGGFLLTWTAEDGGGDSGFNVRAQIFDAASEPVGSQIVANSRLSGRQGDPAVAVLDSGGFVIVWADSSARGAETGPGIWGQRFDAAGVPIGANFLVNTKVGGTQWSPEVTALAGGGFAVSYIGRTGSGSSAYDPAMVQVFDKDGQKQGPEIVASGVGDEVRNVAVTPGSNGSLLVTWETGPIYAHALQAQLIDPQGGLLAERVDLKIHDGHFHPAVAALASGEVVLLWNSSPNQGETIVRGQVLALPLVGTPGEDELTGGTASESFAGLAGADEIAGGGGNDVVEGGAGADRLDGGTGVDTLAGGADNDTYLVDDSRDRVLEASGGGTDTVRASASFTLPDHVERLVLDGSAAIDGYGSSGANILSGNGAANRLDGRLGADEMRGGGGADIYVVDQSGDRVVEGPGGGIDTIESGIDYTLGAEIERLTLIGAATRGTGNALANLLTGNELANMLNGAAGADTMAGGLGDDVYVADRSADAVVEHAGHGTDTVRSSASYVLSDHVETLILTGGASTNATGNALANSLTGNGGSNRLDGAGGTDTMAGGLGHDTYVVDNAADLVVESGSSGNDTVEAFVSYRLPVHLEKLTLLGAGNVDARGNAGANTITGNAGANLINGGSGNDIIKAGSGADRLYGSAGNDSLEGGAGIDRFLFNTDLGPSNVDRILDFYAPSDSIYLSRSVFTKVGANGTLSGASFHNGTSAADSSDRIVYDSATGRIFYDADGSGAASAILFATVAAGTPLTNADFIIYS